LQIAVDGCEISYEMTGQGPPVVLIHGLGGSRHIWSRLREELAQSCTVVAYDLRGSGGTVEKAPGNKLSLAVWSADLRALLEALGIERTTLVGHSLGASIALKYALSWPDGVSALVLMGADPELSRLAPRMEKVVELIDRVGMEEWVAEHWSKNTPFSPASLSRTPEILDEYRAMVLANDPEAYTRTCRAIAQTETLTGRLGEVGQPALVISGSDDDRTVPEAGRELAGALANASYVELEAVGHTVPLEAPAEVAEAMSAFLRRSTDGSRALPGPAG
jgi:pimeloyl-ACP methyl ester carboxylesterase